MAPAWTIRPLTGGDALAAVGVIHAAFRAQSARTDPPSGALRETADSVAAQIAAGGGACAEAGACMVAAILWAEQDGGLHLGRLAVLPAWRRRGLARALVAAAEAEAYRRGLRRLSLGVRLVLEDNRRLFAACGFVETALTSHPGYAEPTSVTMEKRLACI